MKHKVKQIISYLLVVTMLCGSLTGFIPSVENISDYLESVADGSPNTEHLHNHVEAATACQEILVGIECSCMDDNQSVLVNGQRLYRAVGDVFRWVCTCGAEFGSYNGDGALKEHINTMINCYRDTSHQNVVGKDSSQPFTTVKHYSCAVVNGVAYKGSKCVHGHQFDYAEGGATTGRVCGMSPCNSCSVAIPTSTPVQSKFTVYCFDYLDNNYLDYHKYNAYEGEAILSSHFESHSAYSLISGINDNYYNNGTTNYYRYFVSASSTNSPTNTPPPTNTQPAIAYFTVTVLADTQNSTGGWSGYSYYDSVSVPYGTTYQYTYAGDDTYYSATSDSVTVYSDTQVRFDRWRRRYA